MEQFFGVWEKKAAASPSGWIAGGPKATHADMALFALFLFLG